MKTTKSDSLPIVQTPRRFLGVDASTVRQARQGRTLAVVGVELEGKLCIQEIRPLLDDEALLSLLTEEEYTACGLDLPLTLPPCLSCPGQECGTCTWEVWRQKWELPEETFYHYRMSDWLLRKALPTVPPKPPISNGGPIDLTPLTLRWLRLQRQCRREGKRMGRLLEVYASAAVEILARGMGFENRGRFPYRKSVEFRSQWLQEMCATQELVVPDSLWERLVETDDPFDAFVCCWVAWREAKGQAMTPSGWLGWEAGMGLRENPLWNSFSSLEKQDFLELLESSSPGWLPDPRYVFARWKQKERMECL